MKLQAEQPAGWHTVIEFPPDQEAQVREQSTYLADRARVKMRIVDDRDIPQCIYKPGFYAANPATKSTWWQPA